MSSESEKALQAHLADGASTLISAAVDGSTRNVPLEVVKQIVGVLVEGGALSPAAGAGVLAVDARVITEAGKDPA